MMFTFESLQHTFSFLFSFRSRPSVASYMYITYVMKSFEQLRSKSKSFSLLQVLYSRVKESPFVSFAVVYGAQALLGTRFAGRMPRTVVPPSHAMNLNSSLDISAMTVECNFGQWSVSSGDRQRRTNEGVSESEEQERIRIRRERVRLRVQAHRARKRAARQEAERIMTEQMRRAGNIV